MTIREKLCDCARNLSSFVATTQQFETALSGLIYWTIFICLLAGIAWALYGL